MASLNDIETKLQNIIDVLRNIIHTIIGILPLTFTTHTAGNADDWSISGNNNIGKNIVSMADFVNINTNNVVMTADKIAGTISVYTTAEPTASTQQSCGTFSVSESGNYILSGVPSTAPNISLQSYVWDETNSQRARAWNKTSSSDAVTKTTQEAQVYLDKDCTYHVNVRVQTSYGTQTIPVIVSPMIRLDGTSADFEPYQVGVGQRTENDYIIPLSVNGDTVNLPIGNAPLTAGQRITKTSTGVDIELIEGENTITTTLYNKPEMTIKYKI